jgi:hypothetical protein
MLERVRGLLCGDQRTLTFTRPRTLANTGAGARMNAGWKIPAIQ